jgi:hypothetical protein
MDQSDLGVDRYDAGAEYLAAVRKLKLEPDALFWAYDRGWKEFVLVIVTPLFDHAGPLAVIRLLFDAYNASVTPKEIDPFILRLHSPEHHVYQELFAGGTMKTGQEGVPQEVQDRGLSSGEIKQAMVAKMSIGDLQSYGAWVYTARDSKNLKRRSTDQIERQWKRFERSVLAAAA